VYDPLESCFDRGWNTTVLLFALHVVLEVSELVPGARNARAAKEHVAPVVQEARGALHDGVSDLSLFEPRLFAKFLQLLSVVH